MKTIQYEHKHNIHALTLKNTHMQKRTHAHTHTHTRTHAHTLTNTHTHIKLHTESEKDMKSHTHRHTQEKHIPPNLDLNSHGFQHREGERETDRVGEEEEEEEEQSENDRNRSKDFLWLSWKPLWLGGGDLRQSKVFVLAEAVALDYSSQTTEPCDDSSQESRDKLKVVVPLKIWSPRMTRKRRAAHEVCGHHCPLAILLST